MITLLTRFLRDQAFAVKLVVLAIAGGMAAAAVLAPTSRTTMAVVAAVGAMGLGGHAAR